MARQPILVGVDDSEAARRGFAVAQELARTTGAPCQLVHAVKNPWASSPLPQGQQAEALDAMLLQAARTRVSAALAPVATADAIGRMIVRAGRAPEVLNAVAREVNASLIVIGGKRHTMLGRWFGSSTGHGLARTADRPVLVTASSQEPLRRVLAAADFSRAGESVVDTAQDFARMLSGPLRILSVVEPLPVVPEVPTTVDADEYYRWAEADLAARLWPRVTLPQSEKVMRVGQPVETILREVTDWAADLIVVGSHGKNAVERSLLGSVSEGLLNHLPAALLIVPPVRRPTKGLTPTDALAHCAV
ncbi:MAG TPA: universal stress protein [Gemmatimonadales bacterium]